MLQGPRDFERMRFIQGSSPLPLAPEEKEALKGFLKKINEEPEEELRFVLEKFFKQMPVNTQNYVYCKLSGEETVKRIEDVRRASAAWGNKELAMVYSLKSSLNVKDVREFTDKTLNIIK